MHSPAYRVRLHSGATSDQGRVRSNNQDAVYLWKDAHHVMAIVADGMGGAVAGEEASRIAIEALCHQLITDDYPEPAAYDAIKDNHLALTLKNAVQEANLRIVEEALANPAFKGMGTTLTMAFVRDNVATLAHVGDSRAYLIDGHNGRIVQLTSDHSFVQALVDAGHLQPEDAELHPMRNVLYRALGQGGDMDVDTIKSVRLADGDRLLLCSDGLTLHLDTEDIAQIATEYDDPQIIADELVAEANRRGGRDNVTAAIILVEALYDSVETRVNGIKDTEPFPPLDEHHTNIADTLTLPITTTHHNPPEQHHPPVPPCDLSTTSEIEGRDKSLD